ncbi:MAG: cytochrome P450 [Proteobacteria bacterium]|nr:cytochrome P450 [Pseudomonadota bacterium]
MSTVSARFQAIFMRHSAPSEARPGERVVVPDQGLEALAEDVGIDLGGRDVGVAEHLLDRAQIGAVVEQVAGEGVAQDVGRDLARVDAGLGGQLLEHLGEALTGQVAGLGTGGKQPARAGPVRRRRAPRQPPLQCRPGGIGKRYQALFPTLARHQQEGAVAGHRRARQPHQFADPERFDITRNDDSHLAFGFGIHFCVGSPLARLEGQIAFATLARRLSALELRTEAPEYKENIVLRGLRSLPVAFSTASL